MTPPRPAVLLVDGHSMIFALPELRDLHLHRTATARHQLIERLVRYQDNSGRSVIVVFDGRGARTTTDSEETRLQVFYSRSGQSADSVIERLVAKYGKTHDITVATDDHLERTTVETFGGHWISSQQFVQELTAAESTLADTLQSLHHPRRCKLI